MADELDKNQLPKDDADVEAHKNQINKAAVGEADEAEEAEEADVEAHKYTVGRNQVGKNQIA